MTHLLDGNKSYLLNGRTFWARWNNMFGNWELFESEVVDGSPPVFLVGDGGQLLIWPPGTSWPLATDWTVADLMESAPMESS